MAGLAEPALEEVQLRAKGREATAAKRGEAGRSTGKAAHRLPCFEEAVVASHASGEQPALRSLTGDEPLPTGFPRLKRSLRMDANFEAVSTFPRMLLAE